MKDANGIGLGVVSGGNVVGSAGGAILPASAASSTTNYWLGGGTSSRTVTASEAGNSLSIIPGAAGQVLTIGAGTLGLTANLMSFDGTKYPYSINGPGQLGTGAVDTDLEHGGQQRLDDCRADQQRERGPGRYRLWHGNSHGQQCFFR